MPAIRGLAHSLEQVFVKVCAHESANKSVDPTYVYSLQGGAVGGGVQWMGVVLHDETVCNIM